MRKPGRILLIHIKDYINILTKTPLKKIKITSWSCKELPVVFVAGAQSHPDVETNAEVAA